MFPSLIDSGVGTADPLATRLLATVTRLAAEDATLEVVLPPVMRLVGNRRTPIEEALDRVEALVERGRADGVLLRAGGLLGTCLMTGLFHEP